MKKSLFIASLIAAFALAACNKQADQTAPETTTESAPADSDTGVAPDTTASDENQAAPAPAESVETLEAPDAEKSEGIENK